MVTSKGSVNGVEISSFSRNISINYTKCDRKNTSNKGTGESYQIVDTQKLIKRFKNLLQTNEIRDVDLKSCFEENFSGHSLALPALDGINVTCEDSATPEGCYGYNDGIGTPYCITIMESTLSNGIIAFRSRDTTLQEYLHISDVLNTVQQHLGM
ncbi:predicted protein [Nematostella vectensis]|uniref:Anticodon-binding domain-containing protein n=1 Tax=Nematostella vectensis TaxID=45351 RepID=A7SZV8_NEMVE|nr:predicted protein [Nematostella vectensis]|eukprot:XP_001622856.1 predicted protein [Nematostella vectensis]